MYNPFFRSIVLVLVVMIVTTMVVTAKPPMPPSPEEIELPTGIKEKIKTTVKLTNQEKEKSFYLTPKVIRFQRDSSGLIAITYEVGFPSDYLEDRLIGESIFDNLLPSKVYASYDQHYGCDSTSSGCATLTFYYTDLGNHMYANYYTAVWTKIDPAVTFNFGRLGGACYANWYGKNGLCNVNVDQDYNFWSFPVSGTTYSHTPSFSGSGNQTYVDDFNGQYAYQRLYMQRGGTNWQFYFCLAVGGSDLSFGCY